MSLFDGGKITGFQWDAGNRAKNEAKHLVQCHEVEELFQNDPVILRPQTSKSEERWTAYGHTDDGRLLTVVFTVRGSLLRPISARPMSRPERKDYAKEHLQPPPADDGRGKATGEAKSPGGT